MQKNTSGAEPHWGQWPAHPAEGDVNKKHMHGCCADKACTNSTCMELPEGKTCGACKHFGHCEAFYAHKATDSYCDFFPRRFAEPVAPRISDIPRIQADIDRAHAEEVRLGMHEVGGVA